MRDRTPDEHRTALQSQLRKDGGKLREAPDGPVLERFDALHMAQAIEHEINRAGSKGHTKITIHFDLEDAAAFASFMRRASLLGA